MSDERDCVFAQRLLDMARADYEKMSQSTADSARKAVALWMCEQMMQASSNLHIPRALAADLRQAADEIRTSITATRQVRPIPVPDF